MEIERKYLLDQKPDLAGLKHVVMQQHYLSVDPVLRIRKAGEKHIFTYKSGMGMVRQEEEFEISAEDFEKLVRKRIGNGVYKVRYYLPLDEALTHGPDRLSALVAPALRGHRGGVSAGGQRIVLDDGPVRRGGLRRQRPDRAAPPGKRIFEEGEIP